MPQQINPYVDIIDIEDLNTLPVIPADWLASLKNFLKISTISEDDTLELLLQGVLGWLNGRKGQLQYYFLPEQDIAVVMCGVQANVPFTLPISRVELITNITDTVTGLPVLFETSQSVSNPIKKNIQITITDDTFTGNNIRISTQVGYLSFDKIPQDIKIGIFTLVASYEKNRELLRLGNLTDMPINIQTLILRYADRNKII